MKPSADSICQPLRYIDLFAGAGGLSEGFVTQGFEPVAHVEWDKAACNTLRTRQAYHYLKAGGDIGLYESYLRGEITRKAFYAAVQEKAPGVLDSVICEKIDADTRSHIFAKIDALNDGQEIDLIVGGPPCQAFSVAGRARVGREKMENDPRNKRTA